MYVFFVLKEAQKMNAHCQRQLDCLHNCREGFKFIDVVCGKP